jgi:hypothetical protein
MSQNRTAIFFGAIVVAIIAILLAVYYAIPMNSHFLASSPGPHYKHAAVFGAIAAVCIIGALVTRPKSAA